MMTSNQRPLSLKRPAPKIGTIDKHRVFVKESSRGNTITCSCGKNCIHVLKQHLARGKLIKRGPGFGKKDSVTVHAIKTGPTYTVLHVMPATGEKQLKDLRTVKVRKTYLGTYLSVEDAMSAFLAEIPQRGDVELVTSPVEELRKLSQDARPAIYDQPNKQTQQEDR